MNRASLCIPLLAAWAALNLAQGQSVSPTSLISGTWKGESICVGNRPACKNEVVVYRFIPNAGKKDAVKLLADKIINGEREPMGALEFQYDQARGIFSSEFKRGSTHSLWEFHVSGDTMEGHAYLLPEKSVVRNVKVRRVSSQNVPPAPDENLYGGN